MNLKTNRSGKNIESSRLSPISKSKISRKSIGKSYKETNQLFNNSQGYLKSKVKDNFSLRMQTEVDPFDGQERKSPNSTKINCVSFGLNAMPDIYNNKFPKRNSKKKLGNLPAMFVNSQTNITNKIFSLRNLPDEHDNASSYTNSRNQNRNGKMINQQDDLMFSQKSNKKKFLSLSPQKADILLKSTIFEYIKTRESPLNKLSMEKIENFSKKYTKKKLMDQDLFSSEIFKPNAKNHNNNNPNNYNISVSTNLPKYHYNLSTFNNLQSKPNNYPLLFANGIQMKCLSSRESIKKYS